MAVKPSSTTPAGCFSECFRGAVDGVRSTVCQPLA